MKEGQSKITLRIYPHSPTNHLQGMKILLKSGGA